MIQLVVFLCFFQVIGQSQPIILFSFFSHNNFNNTNKYNRLCTWDSNPARWMVGADHSGRPFSSLLGMLHPITLFAVGSGCSLEQYSYEEYARKSYATIYLECTYSQVNTNLFCRYRFKSIRMLDEINRRETVSLEK